MKTVELTDATDSLSAYARQARREPVLVTKKGEPYAALVPVSGPTDLENLVVTTHRKFHKIMDRSEERYEAEGGLTTDQVRERLARKPPRR